jgi:hypothetical protein
MKRSEQAVMIWAVLSLAARMQRGEQALRNGRPQLDQNRARRTRLTDAFLDGNIDKDLLEERKAGLLLDEKSLKEMADNLELGSRSALIRLEKFLERMSKVYKNQNALVRLWMMRLSEASRASSHSFQILMTKSLKPWKTFSTAICRSRGEFSNGSKQRRLKKRRKNGTNQSSNPLNGQRFFEPIL